MIATIKVTCNKCKVQREASFDSQKFILPTDWERYELEINGTFHEMSHRVGTTASMLIALCKDCAMSVNELANHFLVSGIDAWDEPSKDRLT